MTKPLHSAARSLACALACAALLTACGGGGSSSGVATATITAKDGELIVIDAGSSGLAAKTYTLVTNYGASYAVYRDIPTGRLIKVAPENDDFDTNLVYLQGTPAKFLVSLSAQVVGAPLGTYKEFACHSSAWTPAELNAISAKTASLPVCSFTFTIDEANRRATYANISLPALESGGKSVVISAAFSWPVPGLLGGSGGSGGGGTNTTTPAAPLAVLAPQVAPNQVALGGRAGVSLVDSDLYASVGSMLLNSKTLQVIQALTGPYAKLAIVSDPSDRKRYVMLLRTAEVSNPSQSSEYLCSGGTWSTSDLDTLLGETGVQATACAGDIQFVDTSTPTVIMNSVRVANRLSSLPATTVTAYLNTTTGSVNFQGFDKVAHLFQEEGLPSLGQLEITNSTGQRISNGIITVNSPQGTADSLAYRFVVSADGLTVDAVALYEENFPLIYMLRNSGNPQQFVISLLADPDGFVNVVCRSDSLSDTQAIAWLSDLSYNGYLPFSPPATPLEVCKGVSLDSATGRLRMNKTVLDKKQTFRRVTTVAHSATISANIKTTTPF